MIRAAVLVALAGVVVGLGWALLAPGLPVSIRADGVAIVVTPESTARFDPVASFVLALLVAGLVCGALVWRYLPARRRPLLIVTAVGAALVGGVLAQLLGLLVAGLRFPDASTAAPGTALEVAPALDTWLGVLAQPLGVAVMLSAAVTFSHDEELSSGSTATTTVPAAPERPAVG